MRAEALVLHYTGYLNKVGVTKKQHTCAPRAPSQGQSAVAGRLVFITDRVMSRTLAALILLTASFHAAHAAPAQDEMAGLLAQKGLMARLGDTLHQATDRAADLVTTAMDSLGVPYRLGGTSAETGFDCSGFVRATYEQAMGLILPRRAAEQAAATQAIDKADLQPGDLVFFNTLRRAYSHVGIYMGDGKFIHAPRTGSQVRVERMDISYWQRRFNGARRVLDTPPSTSTSIVITRDSPAPRAVRLGGTFGQAPAADRPPAPAAGENI